MNSCTGNGPRGAWNDANFARQQDKIVAAINTMDADIVSLEEIENQPQGRRQANRDEAIDALVDRAQRRRRLDPLGLRAVAGAADLPTAGGART